MIDGIGIDMCDIRRIEAVWRRQGERLVWRILRPAEQAVYHTYAQHNTARAMRYLATRFAAKEALAKATRLGMRAPMGWQSCEILNGDAGQPVMQPYGDFQQWLANRHLHAHISLSDEKHYAIAQVIMEIRKNHMG